MNTTAVVTVIALSMVALGLAKLLFQNHPEEESGKGPGYPVSAPQEVEMELAYTHLSEHGATRENGEVTVEWTNLAETWLGDNRRGNTHDNQGKQDRETSSHPLSDIADSRD